jgi:hypothetical protein
MVMIPVIVLYLVNGVVNLLRKKHGLAGDKDLPV